MVMRVMLIGLLVIGAVAMLETDVSARRCPCGNWLCCYSLEEQKEVVEDAKKDENIQVLLIGATAPSRDKVRQTLIRDGLGPERIGELNLEDRTKLMLPTREEQMVREGQMVIVVPRK